MRSLAREVTNLWLERREEQGFPLGLVPPLAEPPTAAPPAEVDEPGGCPPWLRLLN
jgi:glycyl-tRNA synthetase